MAREKLFQRIAELYFERAEGDFDYKSLVQKLRDEQFKGVTGKTIDNLIRESGKWLFESYRENKKKEQAWDEDPETVGFYFRAEYPHLKAAVLVQQDSGEGNHDYHDEPMCRAARKYFTGLVEHANESQEELHLLVGGGQTIFNVFRPGSRHSSVFSEVPTPYVYCYPSAIVGGSRLQSSCPPDSQMNAFSAWFLTNHEPGRLKYTTIAPPDIADALGYSEHDDRRHAEASRLLLQHTAGFTGDRSIKALLKEMRTANAAIAGFGLIDIPAPEPDSRPTVSLLPSAGTPLFFRGPAARQSRNIVELLQPHGVSLTRLVQEGAVGEYSYCLFDKDGNGRKEWEFFVTPGYPNSVQFYKDMVEDGFTVIGVGNLATLPAIRAALIGKIINVVVTDIPTAKELTRIFQSYKMTEACCAQSQSLRENSGRLSPFSVSVADASLWRYSAPSKIVRTRHAPFRRQCSPPEGGTATILDFATASLFLPPINGGRRHFSRRSSLSISDFGSPPPPADVVLGRRSHPKILGTSALCAGSRAFLPPPWGSLKQEAIHDKFTETLSSRPAPLRARKRAYLPVARSPQGCK